MRRFLTLVVVAIATVMALSLSACTAPTQPGGPAGIVRADPLDVSGAALPDVTDQSHLATARTDSLTAPAGSLRIVYFGYTTCPDICPTTLSDIRGALEELPASQRTRVVVSFATVDPDRDTPERLDAYMSSFFETFSVHRGTPEQLAAAQTPFLARSEIATTPDGVIEVSHTAVTYLVDDTGHVLVEWPFGTPAGTIAHDLTVFLTGLS